MILSDEEIESAWHEHPIVTYKTYLEFARDIERAVLAKVSQQVQGDMAQKIFDASDRKAVDTFKHCPKCDHKCEAMPAPKQEPVLYQAACSGLWYTNPNSCGEIVAVKVGDKTVSLPPQAAAIPEGWQLVPIEPSDEMLAVAWEIEVECHNHGKEPDVIYLGEITGKEVWQAMISAAPKPEGE